MVIRRVQRLDVSIVASDLDGADVVARPLIHRYDPAGVQRVRLIVLIPRQHEVADSEVFDVAGDGFTIVPRSHKHLGTRDEAGGLRRPRGFEEGVRLEGGEADADPPATVFGEVKSDIGVRHALYITTQRLTSKRPFVPVDAPCGRGILRFHTQHVRQCFGSLLTSRQEGRQEQRLSSQSRTKHLTLLDGVPCNPEAQGSAGLV